jgi:hypothetical protein
MSAIIQIIIFTIPNVGCGNIKKLLIKGCRKFYKGVRIPVGYFLINFIVDNSKAIFPKRNVLRPFCADRAIKTS